MTPESLFTALFTLRERNTIPANPHSVVKGLRQSFRRTDGATFTHTTGIQLSSGLFIPREQGEEFAT